jgi:trehalose-6-phosphate synthase
MLLSCPRGCTIIVDFEELHGAEAISQVMMAFLRLLKQCPKLREELDFVVSFVEIGIRD